ncbi:MAG: thioredoxin family protein [Verrucomicrobia bacterium]|nr:thioredoxin family protein [Verrucomicrobiota bacterium]
MKTPVKLLIIAAVAIAAVAAVALKQTRSSTDTETPAATPSPVAAAAVEPAAPAPAPAPAKLPKLIDLGADKCIPCKMMAPILAEFKRDYADQFVTEFIDVWKDSAPAKQYGIRAIPTQIFFDAEGKELFRHEGFYGKDDMLNKWKELGVTIRSPAAAGK